MRLFSLFFSYVFRDTIRSKALLVLILTVLAAAAAAILLTLGVLEGFRTILAEGERGWLGDVVISPRDGDVTLYQSDEIVERLKTMSSVEAFSIRSKAQTVVHYKEEDAAPFRTIGIMTNEENSVTWFKDKVIEGSFFSDAHTSDEVVLGKGLADDLVGIEGDGKMVHVGDVVQVLNRAGTYRSMRVRGIVDAKNFSPNWVLFLQKSDLEQIDSTGRNAQMILKLRPGGNPIQVRQTLQNLFPSIVVRTWEEESQYVRDVMTAVKFITLSIRDLLLIMVFFVVSIVVYIDISQKRHQIGILKSMGTPRLFIILAYATQAFIYALVGTSIGSLLFSLITLWSENHPVALMIGDFRLIETGSLFFQTAVTVFLSALIGAFAPVWVAVRTKIIDDLRYVA